MKIKYLVIHNSAGNWGNKKYIDLLHKSRGFQMIGYHFVIGNGYPDYKCWATEKYIESQDGLIELGRSEDKVGAHCAGLNSLSLGLCLIGNGDLKDFTEKQYLSLKNICINLMTKYQIPIQNIIGHREAYKILGQPVLKTCPGKKINLTKIRNMIREV